MLFLDLIQAVAQRVNIVQMTDYLGKSVHRTAQINRIGNALSHRVVVLFTEQNILTSIRVDNAETLPGLQKDVKHLYHLPVFFPNDSRLKEPNQTFVERC